MTSAKTHSLRPLVWLLALCVFVPLLVCLGIALFYDIAAPRDADMALPAREKHVGENELEKFCKDNAIAMRRWRDLLSPIDWWSSRPKDSPDLRQFKDVVDDFRELLGKSHDQIRWQTETKVPRGDSLAAGLGAAIGIWSRVANEDPAPKTPNAMLTEALQVSRLGQHLCASDGGLYERQIALHAITAGAYAMRDALNQGTDLEAAAEGLKNLRFQPDQWRTSLRIEYGKLDGLITEARHQTQDSFAGVVPNWMRFTIKRNFFKAEWLAAVRPLDQAFAGDWTAAAKGTIAFRKDTGPRCPCCMDQREIWLSAHGGGKILLLEVLSLYSPAFERAIRAHILLELVGLQVALRRYEVAEGHLPNTLAELCPRFLDQVPTDPYSGQGLLWEPGKNALYSVGSDGADQGGTLDDSEYGEFRDRHGQDLGLYYWWAKK